MNKLETLKPGDDVWHRADRGPRQCMYVRDHGLTRVEVHFHGIPEHVNKTDCYARKSDCYAMAAWKTMEAIRDQLDSAENYLATVAEELTAENTKSRAG